MKYASLYIVVTFASLLLGCGRGTIDSAESLYAWMNDQDNGLVITKYVNGIKLTAKYLPPAYLAYKEWVDSDKENLRYQDVLSGYQNNRTFLLTIGPDDREVAGGDVMFYNVLNEKDYRQRVQDLNFDIGKYISLNVENRQLAPKLHTLENTYGLGNHRNIYLVFADDKINGSLLTGERLDLKFIDGIFQTGISHFVFDKQDLDGLPKMKFLAVN